MITISKTAAGHMDACWLSHKPDSQQPVKLIYGPAGKKGVYDVYVNNNNSSNIYRTHDYGRTDQIANKLVTYGPALAKVGVNDV